jgi:predicted transcriptional regulator
MKHLFLPINPVPVHKIFYEKKTCEIRTKAPHIDITVQPLCVFFYETAPASRVRGFARITDIVTDIPEKIWQDYQDRIKLTHSVYCNYTDTHCKVTAILIEKPVLLAKHVGITELTTIGIKNFRSFTYVEERVILELCGCKDNLKKLFNL